MATILVVDDLAANRELLVTLLGYQGHRLLQAADGAQGLAAVRAERPDLVITDVLMPVMDGYELVRRLRLDPSTRTLPVVFHTAHYGEREARELALSSGVSHVMTKPTEPEEVLRVVDRVLSGEHPTAPPDAPLAADFDREHLRLLTDKLSENAADLRAANARLRALVNIGLELASERDAGRLLASVCAAARDLFGATYVTLGLVGRDDRRIQRLVADGAGAGEWIAPGDAVPGGLVDVVEGRRTVRGENPGGGPAALGLPAGHPPVHAWLAAPIASPAHVYGWICLVGNEGRAFAEDDEHLLLALSGQVGRIYENGYFYSVARERADALEREVAERERAEREFRALFAANPLPMWIYDLDSLRFLEVNEAAVRHYGYAYSEPGRGTSLKVYFPRAGGADAEPNQPAPAPRPQAGTQTVLVVEDAEGLRALARLLLERQGYRVLAVENADEAQRIFAANPSIDVLLTDVVMPGSSGPELSARLLELRPELKVIYMSGYTEEAIVQRGVLVPGIAFLHKPFTSGTLGAKLREVLDR